MSRGKRDAIATVEACYRLDVDDAQWLREAAEALADVFGAEHGLVGYQLRHDDFGFQIVGVEGSPGVPPAVMSAARTFSGLTNAGRRGPVARNSFGRLVQSIFRAAVSAPEDRILMSERPMVGPEWLHHFFQPLDDQLNLITSDLRGEHRLVFVGGLVGTRPVRDDERELAVMLLAHARAAARLRRKGPAPVAEAPAGGAVLEPGGRLLHAEGDARAAERRAALEEAARRMDEARTRAGGRGPDAVEIWRGLVDGRWSLVEAFDTDGKRLILAHENPPGVRDPRALTELEARVVSLAARGHSDKLIAYTLGVARSTAAGHLASAMRKLRISSRVELIRFLGPWFTGPECSTRP